MLEITLLTKDTVTIEGLLDGSLKRHGSIIRETSTSCNVRFLIESPEFTNQIMTLSSSPLLGGALGTDVMAQSITTNPLIGINVQDFGTQQLSSLLQIGQIAAGASVLNLGVSLAGFAYMGYKLHQIQNSLGQIQQSMEAGFNRIEERLDKISGQLTYLHLIVEDSRQKQQLLAQAISNLQRTILIREISDLASEILYRNRFPDSSEREALKIASRVRIFLSNQVMQATPELEAEIMLNSDISLQGWAVATAVEAHLLLEVGKIQEARELLAQEVSKFKEVALRWADHLVNDENPQLATAYRFTAPYFKEHISTERVKRISDISTRDCSLSSDKIRRKKNEVEVEFELFNRSRYNEAWIRRQVAIAEYLDALSELSARLESLQVFATLCASQNVKSSKEILLDANVESGLYTISISSDA